ncbi:gp53-like domain-containing protein [Pseudomonas pseudonitroreducens]|uniref:gp53-like domain-containing protein n=1 Tax=Pseudomonas pseudonitroreducens TaxID=2892326 RepID=UPI001F46BCBA|nr:hypothetical protein [Pseudomonas pseudonitroreducens]
MPTNDFLPFAGGVGSNVLTQAAYASLAARTAGFSAGVAKSAELNKVWRQSSIISAVIGQFINDLSGQDALDDGTIATLLANFKSSIGAVGRLGSSSYVVDTGTANTYVATYTPAVTALTDGMVLRFKAANANTGASTFNPNGTGAKPIVGGAHAALQGGEIVANSSVWLQYNSSIGGGSWVLIDSTGGAMQAGTAVQSLQAVNLAEFAALFASTGYMKFPAIVGGVKRTLILQWVTQGGVGAGGKVDNFPIAFPTVVLIEWAAISVTGGPLTQYVACVGPASLTSIQTVVNTGSASVAAFALGY